MFPRFQSKPTEVEAVQWMGVNFDAISKFAGKKVMNPMNRLTLFAGFNGSQGWVHVPVGHYIVAKPGDRIDIWPVAEEYFLEKYERIEE